MSTHHHRHLFESLQVNESDGTVRDKNRRLVLYDANALGLLRRQLVTTLGRQFAGMILFHFGYSAGYSDALANKDPRLQTQERWQEGLDLMAAQGMAAIRPRLVRFGETADLTLQAELEWRNSYEAEEHLKHLGPSEAPVCWAVTAYLSGYSTAVLGCDVIFIEKECVGKGDPVCAAIGRGPSHNWTEGLELAKKYFQGENFDAVVQQALQQMSETRALIQDLEQQREKVRFLESQVYYLQEASQEEHHANELIGSSAPFKRMIKAAKTVAGSDSTVLLQGETGTGKELIARFVHSQSARRNRPLITVNCAALPGGLVESELFGHEKGAFTGAVQRKPGRFEIANGGTIFLDEIGDLPLEAQAKLLRALQEGEFERVGGTSTIKVDVRVLTATNRPLQALVEAGKFRADLYYRLNVFPIEIPPLRERGDDIVLLVNYFAQKFRAQFRKQIRSVSLASLENLKNYHWPGNVRQLEHIIEHAVLVSEGEILTVDPPVSRTLSLVQLTSEDGERLLSLEEMERRYIEEVLHRTGGRIAGEGGAAQILKLPASTLRSRMKKLRIL